MSKQYSIEDVAEIADRSVQTIRKWVRRKKLKVHKSRQYLVGGELREFLLELDLLSKRGRKKKSVAP